ncbi:MAG: TRAP transporter substrate-binding protein DctP [Oscillospiraceae bacterium]|nr:TRAP transporter substrate-binding protein DctP [Oscillospiraceae bacterium]
MTKRIIAFMLALVCLLSVCACGSQTSDDSSAVSESVANETTEVATEAEETEEAKEAEAENPVTLIFASNKNESEDGGQVIKYFCDYVTEASGGTITFEIFWGGTMCSMAEEFEMVSSGSADICALNQLPFGSLIPLAQFPNSTCTGYEGTVDYANYVLFDNEESSTLIRDEFADNNLYYVGYSLNGSSGYYCNFEAYSLEDMAGKKFGTGKSGALQKDYGLNVVSMESSAGYDSLQRAVVDCTDLTMGAAYSNSWQEVADYWVFYGLVSFGNFFTLNLDTWNSLTAEQQEIFNEAGLATLQFSIDQVTESESAIVEAVEAEGVTVTFVEGEAQEIFAEKSFRLDCENALANAVEQGKGDEMKTVLSVAAEALGIDISDILEAE